MSEDANGAEARPGAWRPSRPSTALGADRLGLSHDRRRRRDARGGVRIAVPLGLDRRRGATRRRDWQIEHVASVLGHADLALRWAERALERAIQNGWTDWRLASCYEGWLGPTRPAGNGRGTGPLGGAGSRVLDGLDDADDRELIASQLASVPGIAPPDGIGDGS